jgi:hypothetical protein
MIEIGENDEVEADDPGGVANEDFRLEGLPVDGRMLDPPPGCDCCLHFRMDLWLIGVVLEQLVSQSSKAESLPSVRQTLPLLSTSFSLPKVGLLSTSEAGLAAWAAAAASKAACCNCTILDVGNCRWGGVGVSSLTAEDGKI